MIKLPPTLSLGAVMCGTLYWADWMGCSRDEVPSLLALRTLMVDFFALIVSCEMARRHVKIPITMLLKPTAIKNPWLQVRRNISYDHSNATKQDPAWPGVMRLPVSGIEQPTYAHYKVAWFAGHGSSASAPAHIRLTSKGTGWLVANIGLYLLAAWLTVMPSSPLFC